MSSRGSRELPALEDGRQLDAVATGSALLLAAKVVGNAGFFAAVLILARALGPTGRGGIAFVVVTAMVIARLAAVGVAEATTVFAAQRPAARAALLANAVAFSLLGSTLVAAACAAGLLVVAEVRPVGLGWPEWGILIVSAAVTGVSEAGYSFLLGCGRLRVQAVVTASISWLYAALLAAAWAGAGLTVLRAAAIWTVAQAARAGWVLWSSTGVVAFGRPDLGLLRESIAFGVRAWVGSLARFMNFRVDQVLMGFIASEAALGIYAVAVNASEVLLYLAQATAVALLPLVARSDPALRLDHALRAFRSVSLITAATVVGAAVVGPPLLPLVFGSDYRASVVPFLWLLPGALGFVGIGVFSSALVASSQPALSSLGPVVALALGLALDVLLIPPFGASGAAAAATLAFLAGGVASLLAYRRREPFPWSALLLPRRGDLDVLRALAAPVIRVALARRRSAAGS